MNDTLSLNWYVYCGNNPLIFIDPSGHNYQDLDPTAGMDDYEAIQYFIDKYNSTDNWFAKRYLEICMIPIVAKIRYRYARDMFAVPISASTPYVSYDDAKMIYDLSMGYIFEQIIGSILKSSQAIEGTTSTKPYTKSSLKMGQEMHKAYKADVVDNITKFKEFRLPSGKRIDYIDFETKTIYELKPYNPNRIKSGINQLDEYLKEVESIYGDGWKTVLDTY